ncbi:hypothetical protein [Polymorphobacter megasporae]|uniref:hypothetical protein n=1 Tax=Glacieibacterium megasporae TaxID=2835787 RepID=UPI001C1E0EA9|nr:hypothetical protein [Polymorphobacter megasporae]UAJ10636.1 hypothetical protein KTC28_02450 [Polymorphobacter megasporae]
MIYRIEWREGDDITLMPGFCRWLTVSTASEARSTAIALADDGTAVDGEFHVAVLGLGGRIERVATTYAAVVTWDVALLTLPEPVLGGRWTADLNRDDAAAELLVTVKAATARAYAAGSIGRERAQRLMSEMRVALDDGEEDDEPEA